MVYVIYIIAVWGTKLPRLPPVLAVPTLRLLREYMSSAPEEHAAEQLWNGFLGASGTYILLSACSSYR